MPYFDRFDICGAYLALENDWNSGGWLHARPSNQRRKESTGVQLSRMGFKPAQDSCCAFEYLENDNQREIYVRALVRFNMGVWIDNDDNMHHAVIRFLRKHCSGAFIARHMPQLVCADIGYLQHGRGTDGPFRTESVRIKNEYADRWLAWFEGKWRRVFIQVNRTFIRYQGESITIQIEGV